MLGATIVLYREVIFFQRLLLHAVHVQQYFHSFVGSVPFLSVLIPTVPVVNLQAYVHTILLVV
jgi:hypothetical protein